MMFKGGEDVKIKRGSYIGLGSEISRQKQFMERAEMLMQITCSLLSFGEVSGEQDPIEFVTSCLSSANDATSFLSGGTF